MRILSATTGQATPRSHLVSFGGHVVLVALAMILPTLGLLPEPKTEFEVQFVRLKGGGEMLPGWVKPTPAPPDEALEPDNKPQEQPKPVEEKPKPAEPKPAPVEQEKPAPAPAEAAEEKPEPREQTPAATGDPAASEQATEESATGTEAESTAPSSEGETGAGVGAKPGPEGPGIGATSDLEFTGANAYLSRIEAEVQRRFNFRGQATGKVAEYHFTLDKKGELHDLVLMVSSGVPSLDLAARSALTRANFPPLPGSFPSDRLGITYKFHGDGSR
ncbi:TonB C-terminal domain-containing protein [bacterium]|nr:TonB C-terminal domain-containing protein [bacterium]